MSEPQDWIAARRPPTVSHDAVRCSVRPMPVVARKGYAVVLGYQGQPVNPFDDAIKDIDATCAAVDEPPESDLRLRVQS